jgi:very-short-patch-repair endonuclease
VATIGRINPHARQLRREAADAEIRLWSRLCNRQLGGFKFKQQETVGRCIADFACVERRLIVEADGGQHSNERDGKRTAYLEELGWQILRFWNTEILQQTDGVLEQILAACEKRKEVRPSPLPQAGEVK